MTNKEAIEILKRLQDPEPWEPQLNSIAYSALDMAISTLEKQEGKKPITVETNIYAADVVAVVRCKDCRYSYDSVGGLCCSHGVCVDCVVPEDFFCRYGKRKGGDE